MRPVEPAPDSSHQPSHVFRHTGPGAPEQTVHLGLIIPWPNVTLAVDIEVQGNNRPVCSFEGCQ